MNFLTFATIIRLFFIVAYVICLIKQYQHPKPEHSTQLVRFTSQRKRINRKYFWYRFLKRTFLIGGIIALCLPAPYTVVPLFFAALAVFARPFYKEDFPYFADWHLSSAKRPLTLIGLKNHWKELQFI